MRFGHKILIFTISLFLISCASESKPSTPFETFAAYTKAIKRKDTEAMKLMLSDATLKMHEQEAKAQNSNLDEIIKRQTLFGENQTEVKYRNEKIEGDRATLEIMNAYSMWQKVPFVRETESGKLIIKALPSR
jgi:thioredoxin-related protein